jgi:hypothetical protein
MCAHRLPPSVTKASLIIADGEQSSTAGGATAFGRLPSDTRSISPAIDRPLLGNTVEKLDSILIFFGADFGE